MVLSNHVCGDNASFQTSPHPHNPKHCQGSMVILRRVKCRRA